MVRTGRVVSAQDGKLEVCFERPEMCAHCGGCAGQPQESLVRIPGDAPVGSRIDVDMPEGQVLKASFLAYVIPLAMLLLGLWLGSALFQKEAFAALAGIGCMLLSWFALRWVDGAVKKRAGWSPRIVKVHDEDPPA